MNGPYRLSAASAALLCWNAAIADTLPPAPNDNPIEEIIIRADPLRTLSDHRSAPVAVVKGNSLLGAAVDTLGAAVEQVPGVNVSTFGNAVGRPVIRGLGGARVRVLENGLGAMDVSTVSPDHAVAAEPVFAEQIEIFRGPATLLFGSGASGGLVNVVNRRLLREVPATPAADAFT
jgi:iron complex outermembrane receptor protein